MRLAVMTAAALSHSILGAAVTHAGDIVPNSKEKLAVQAGCENMQAPKCTVGLQAQHGASPPPMRKPAPPPAPPVPPPPSCHYEQDFTYTVPASVRAEGAPSQMAVQNEVCPAGAQPVGTPIS